MSTTAFTSLYPFIRTLLGDTARLPVWSNDQIDMGLRLGLLQEEDYVELTDISITGDKQVSPELPAKIDYLRVSVRAALALITPAATEGSYRTPMLSVTRGANVSYQDMKMLLQKLVNGGDSIIVSDNEFDQMINGFTTVPTMLSRFGVLNGIVDWKGIQ